MKLTDIYEATNPDLVGVESRKQFEAETITFL